MWRATSPDRARLLLVENVIPSSNEPTFGKLLDLAMLVLFHNGRERTEAEYRDLLEQGGFALTRVVPTVAGISVIEAAPV